MGLGSRDLFYDPVASIPAFLLHFWAAKSVWIYELTRTIA
jgi:hypothetical protein